MPERSNATPLSILVAEDERVMSDVIRFNLLRAGYAVSVARNGEDAWEQLREKSCQLLLTDFQMPRMTGVELCRKLRSEFPEWPLPVVLLSARGLELNAAALQSELGFSAILFKPFSPRELVHVVADSLAKSICSSASRVVGE